jgi:hypothetical protein
MGDQVTITLGKGRDKTLGLRASGGRQQFGCSGPPFEDVFMVHGVGLGIAQTKGRHGPSSNGRADSFVQLQEPEPCQRVRGVVGQPERSQQVLYVGGLDEAQAPILDVGNSSTPKLKFEHI